MSWAFDFDPGGAFGLAIQRAAEMDRVLVSIAGNISKGLTEVGWPGRYPEVLAVGNMDETFELFDSASGPNVGDVSLVAPVGAGIPANTHTESCAPHPCPLTETVDELFGGTSAAAPQVAGVAALLKSRFPNLGQEEIRSRIQTSAEWYWEDADSNYTKFGTGKLNAYRALTEWGSIIGNVEWDPNDTRDGAYYISGDLTIEAGATLTINKGTVIKIAPDHERKGTDLDRVEIIVKGTLKTGPGGGEVVFEAFNDAPTGMDWVGITFDPGSYGDVLEDVVIKDGIIGVQTTTNASVTLRRCEISASSTGVLNWWSGSTTIEDCDISGGSQAVMAHSGTVTIDGTTIHDAVQGVQIGSISGFPTMVSITDSHIHDIGINGVVSLSDPPADQVSISGTTIENCYYGVLLGASVQGGITDCSIRQNDTGIFSIGSGVQSFGVSDCSIYDNATNGIYYAYIASIYPDNEISGNLILDNPVGIFCYSASPDIGYANMIQLNGTGIKCDAGAVPVVEWNRFVQNGTAVGVYNGANPDLGDLAGGSLGRNRFENSATYDVANNTAGVVMAEDNWWGQATGPDPAKILGSVDYVPWAPTIPPPPPTFVYELPAKPQNPEKFALGPSYPNPFNPLTTIPYEVPEPGGLIQLVLYDARGKQVRALRSGVEPPGFHSVEWRGRNDRGQPVASGVYLVRLSAPGFVDTRKVVFLK